MTVIGRYGPGEHRDGGGSGEEGKICVCGRVRGRE